MNDRGQGPNGRVVRTQETSRSTQALERGGELEGELAPMSMGAKLAGMETSTPGPPRMVCERGGEMVDSRALEVPGAPF